ncbi:restriction endonuclease subunit S [[Haemophilus] felis]|nr:restriction endonuclease subunit S [[Haemophilus] felis]
MNKLVSCQLGDLIEFQRGYDLPRSEFIEGEYPVQSSNGILGYHNEYKVKAPGITIGRSGTVGIPHLLRKHFFPHNTALFVKDFKGNDVEYIYYLLHYLDLGNKKSGSGVPTMNRNHLHPLKIKAYTDLQTQQKIAQVLSTLDRKIALNQQINTELEKMAKTLYDYWFVQFDFPDENGNPYKSSCGEMVYNPELKREVPKGWGVKNLFDCCNVQYGFPFSTEFFNEEKQGYPVIRIRDILNNQITNYSTEIGVDEKYKINIGDILVGMDGNFHINYWSDNDCYLNQRVVKINSDELPNIYVKYQIEPTIKAREKSVSRTTVGHLSDKDLKAINIIIPSDDILNKFCKLYDGYLSKMMGNLKQTQKLTQLRDFLLPMLMNGQVEVE